jgi:LEA14-like dessication related protein
MSLKVKLIIGLVVISTASLSAYILYPKKIELQEIIINKIPNLTKDTINIDATASFYNPNLYGVSIRKYDIDVFLKGEKIGRLDDSTITLVHGEENFSIPIKVSFKKSDFFSIDDFMNQILTLFVSNDIKIRFLGNVHVKVLGIESKIGVDYSESMMKHLKENIK